MKRIIALLIALTLCFGVLAGCEKNAPQNEEETKEKSEKEAVEKDEKEEKKEKSDPQPVFYIKDNSERFILLTGETEGVEIKDAETYIDVSSDGKYIYYGVDYDEDDEDFTLVYASAKKPNDYEEIDSNVTEFGVGDVLTYNKNGKFYLSKDMKSKGEKIGECDGASWTDDFRYFLYIDGDDQLILLDAKDDEETVIAENVTGFDWDTKAFADNRIIFYEQAEWLDEEKTGYHPTYYCWNDGEIEETDYEPNMEFDGCINGKFYYTEDYDNSGFYMQNKKGKFEPLVKGTVFVGEGYNREWETTAVAVYGVEDEELYYINSEGKVTELECDKVVYGGIAISGDGKNIAMACDDGVIYMYTIKDGKLTNETVVWDEFDDIGVDADDLVYGDEEDGVIFGIDDAEFYSGGLFFEVTVISCIEGVYSEKYDEGLGYCGGELLDTDKIDCLDDDADYCYYIRKGNLYKCNVNEREKIGELVDDDIEDLNVVNGEYYYIVDGELYMVGSDVMIDDDVANFGSWIIDTEEEYYEEEYYEEEYYEEDEYYYEETDVEF